MARITLHLTFTSASIVSLALVAQVSGFGPSFRLLAVGLSGSVLLLGSLTLVRVFNASNDDLALVMGMNRLRRAYVDIDAGVEQYLITGTTEDPAGVGRTYTMVGRRSASQFFGSTALFLLVVNVLVAGVFAALVAGSWDLERPVVGLLGLLGAAAYVLVVAVLMRRTFARDHPDFAGWPTSEPAP
jgi:hypothetical protein